jgi:dTDP-4-amino-4,6-dideoxygalactose transaminase
MESTGTAERGFKDLVCLPCHPTMTDEDCAYLYGVLEDFIRLQRGN